MRQLSALRQRHQRGFVLIMMGALAILILGASGLALDLGRVFIAKQETQTYVDAGAVAAALELDGTSAGLTRAVSAAANVGNGWKMDSTSVPMPTVEFATSAAGPWSTNPNPATGYIAARVQASVTNNLWFLPLVSHQNSTPVVSRAVAIQKQISSFSQGLAPYTAVAQSSTATGPNFGLVRGQSYSIQWAHFSGGSNCKSNNPDKCFTGNICPGDNNTVKWAVASNWGSGNSGYWGFTSNSDIEASILDGVQTQPVAVGDNIASVLTNGQKQSQASYLDERAAQDYSNYAENKNGTNFSSDVSTYLADGNHDGRRLLTVPIVYPDSPTQTGVRGFGIFMLLSNGNNTNFYKQNTNGNDAFCAVYVGAYTVGSNDAGGATSGSGAYQVTLVE
jgi:Flp pilus assembly protein TadG